MRDFTEPPAFDIKFQWTGESFDDQTSERNKTEAHPVEVKTKLAVKDAEFNDCVRKIFDNLEAAVKEATEYSASYKK